MNQHTTQTPDGRTIAITTFIPEHVHATLVIAPALGVSQRFYAPFAEFFKEQGFCVVTFDYRGISASKDRPTRDDPAILSDWGRHDLHTVLGWAHALDPTRPLRMVGHSVGGQLIGLAANNKLLDAVYLVSSQSGWIFHWSGLPWFGIAALFGAIIPLTTPLFKKLPGPLLGGADIPAGVALQWAKWGRNPRYLTSDAEHTLHFETLTAVVRPVSIGDDDGYAPGAAVRALSAWMTHATLRPATLFPHAYGLREIGHFGYFRKDNGPTLWPHAAAFLRTPTSFV